MLKVLNASGSRGVPGANRTALAVTNSTATVFSIRRPWNKPRCTALEGVVGCREEEPAAAAIIPNTMGIGGVVKETCFVRENRNSTMPMTRCACRFITGVVW